MSLLRRRGAAILPSSAVKVIRTTNAADPRTVLTSAALDRQWAAGMDGHTGFIRIGQPSPGGVGRFAGELGIHQAFYGGAFLGKVRPYYELREEWALPHTSPPPGATTSPNMADKLLAAGL